MLFIDTKRAYDNKKTTKEKNIDLVKFLGLPVTSYSPAYIFNHSLTNGTRTLSCFLICFTSFSWKFIQRETHDHLKFSPAARLFIYIPIEHSEDRGKQVGKTWYFPLRQLWGGNHVLSSFWKPWPSGLSSRRNWNTWVYLRLRLARACVHVRWLAMACAHRGRDQICQQVDPNCLATQL